MANPEPSGEALKPPAWGSPYFPARGAAHGWYGYCLWQRQGITFAHTSRLQPFAKQPFSQRLGHWQAGIGRSGILEPQAKWLRRKEGTW